MPLLAIATCAERILSTARALWLAASITAALLLNASTVRAEADACAALVQRRTAREPQLFYIKSKNLLCFVTGEQAVWSRPASHGSAAGPKWSEGDRRTPEGRYRVLPARKSRQAAVNHSDGCIVLDEQGVRELASRITRPVVIEILADVAVHLNRLADRPSKSASNPQHHGRRGSVSLASAHEGHQAVAAYVSKVYPEYSGDSTLREREVERSVGTTPEDALVQLLVVLKARAGEAG
jgi:hypothetical protein